MKSKDKSLKIILTMMPDIEKDQLPDGNEHVSVKAIKHGKATLRPKKPISLNELKTKRLESEFTIEDAKKNYQKVNREYKNRYKTGDKKAVIELLERYPWFISESWVVKALKEKPVRSGKKWGDTKISRTLITALVNALKKKGCSKDRTFRILSGRIGIGYGRIRDLYYDTEKSLINKPFAMPANPIEGIDEYESMDFEQFVSEFIKDAISKGPIYPPKFIVEGAIQRYGDEKAKKAMSVYIEEAQKLLNKDDGNEIIQEAKKILIKNCFIEKAKSLMAQL